MRFPLLRTALAGLRMHWVRLLMTAAAIVVGVSFLAGSLVYGDTARAAFYDDLAKSSRNVDVVVQSGWSLLDRDTLDRVRAVDGVAAADGRVIANLGMLGADGKLLITSGHVGYGISVPTSPGLSRFDVAEGRVPERTGEIAVERQTAEQQGFTLGGVVRLVGPDGAPVDFTLVGVLDLGVNKLFGGASVGALTDADLLRITNTNRYTQVVATAAPGVSQEELRARVRAAVPGGWTMTGDELAAELATEAAKYVDGFLSVLIGFGLVALTVSGFVIYNTFAVLAAQRARELALLRCVGASRPQVLGTVLIEASVLGVLASLGGVLASLVVGWGLLLSRELVATSIPDHPLVLRWPTVLVAVGFGTALTLLGALVPAVAASRVPPLTALRDAGTREHRETGRRARAVACAVPAGLGLLIALAGLGLDFAGLPLVLGGAMLIFLGMVAGAPLVIGRVIRALGALPARVFGVPVRLATLNAYRNPRRVAATTSALMIGVTLMSLFSVLLATARDQAGRELTENFPVDFVLTPKRVNVDGPVTAADGVPRAAIDALAARPELATVAPARLASRETDPDFHGDGAVWATSGEVRPEVKEGDLGALTVGTAAVQRDYATARGAGLGDRLTLPGGGTVRIIALYDDAPLDASVMLSWDGFTAAYGAGQPNRVLIDVAAGTTTDAARRVVDAALAGYPLVQVESAADQAESLSASLDELLAIFAALLGMSVLIALFGIGNTLSLSVFERTRESATLRALGLTRAQLRATLLSEAALMALVGALTGVVFGAATGWAASLGLISAYGSGAPVLPVGQLALFALVATLSALVAAVLPARRAARASVVSALSDA
ncbi:ABC transporter permease [Catenuloplanes atrovinosus]|uniref:ABC transport system permease protein n=1 Tax=Catenuloplanes atrovinosus TaxID=137266 RepID=A0AAE4CB98_9ACTN|nr:FtsX-like permease family protein [Catenuloplanes atrovinosus]MDR7278456.1 putative ABC transport system permease protein [Catenuloplanes atrovinosus]